MEIDAPQTIESRPDAPSRRRWRFQYSLRTFLLVCVAAATLWATGVAIWREYADPMRYSRRFHRAIASADRVVIHSFVFDRDGVVVGPKVLCELAGPEEIAELREHLQFAGGESSGACMCYGFPGIDWYCGDTRVALTRLKHGQALAWQGFPGDAAFTPESSAWIVRWLADRGIAETPFAQSRVDEKRIRQLLPPGFVESVAKAREERMQRAWDPDLELQESEEDLIDKYVRERCPDRAALFSTLFRAMSFAPRGWDSLLQSDQVDTCRFLTRAGREELDGAFRAAAHSDDPAERQGAARCLFIQDALTPNGASEADIARREADVARWIEWFVRTAYSDVWAGNRRLVLKRLIEYPRVPAMDVLAEAIEDPDAAVRQSAIEALRVRGSPEAIALLRRVADGRSTPRKPSAAQDDSFGDIPAEFADLEREEETTADRDAAREALRALGQP